VQQGDGAVLCIASQGQRLLVSDAAGVISELAEDGVRLQAHKVSQTWLWSVVCVSPTQVVCGDEEGVLRLCELPIVRAERRPGRGAVHALVSLEDGRICAGFASGHLALYQVADGQLREQAVWKAHDAEVYSVTNSQGLLASGGEDGQLHLWDVSGPPRLVCSHPHPAFVRSVTQDQHGVLWTGCYDGLVRRFERK
jgi:WD40 repeat protein